MGSLAKRIPGISVEEAQRNYYNNIANLERGIRAEAKQIQENYRTLSAPNKKAYAINADASYEVGGAYALKDDLELQHANIQVTTDRPASLAPPIKISCR